MPIVKFIKNEKQNPSAMKGSIDYCLQKYKTVDVQTGQRYVSGINCNGLNAYKEFMTTKIANNANSGRYFYQYVQSFSPKNNVNYDKAHKIALEFAEKAWQGHEVLVTTHCDRNHIHTHFIINSVSFETGKKLRQNPNTLKSLRKLNDEICAKYDVVPLKPYTKTKEKRLSDGEYRMAMKGESWKFALMFTIDTAMKKCKTKKEFIDEMKKNGYEVLWTDARKYITYICPNGMKCRDIKLHQDKYRKEKMELEFELRRIETEKCTAESYSQRYDSENGTGITGDNRGERLLESTDRTEQKSESTVESNLGESSERRYNQSLFSTNNSSTEKENFGTGEHDSERTEESGNDAERTGWEDEREYAFGRKRDDQSVGQTEKEMDSDILWNDDRHSSVFSDTLYFAGDLFKMIDNQTRYHRKRIKLSQKEIEKRLAHGQKSDGYEEYEDYYNQLTM
ncbi:MAG: relaxase/mobilization nuclease domain-containing protein [Acetobacter sp.]|nr:relaxase/mobilization nuclease domain-containing protein [Bacteroides sp.]MCM1341620.1 relaxase/mobilization nuclease domain-containing protein [Acetobacter sp.]MCM1434059.1 relaxase/mobilization nuclease domain-containing protein [Clostridiales bacterium]